MNRYLLSILLFLLIIGSFLVYYFIYTPSKLSVEYFCNEISLEEINEKGYNFGGYYLPSEDTITLLSNKTTTFKHELCHKRQNEVGRLGDCNHKFNLLLNEFECHFAEFMPKSLFNRIYL